MSAFTVERLPPRSGEPSRRPQTPGGRNDWRGTAARSSVWTRIAGSSAAATAWRRVRARERLLLGLEGEISDAQARGRTGSVVRRGGPAGNQMSSDRESNSASAFSSVATSRNTIRSGLGRIRPVARHRLQRHPPDRGVDDPVRSATDESGRAVRRCRRRDREARMREHGEQRRVGLDQDDLDGPRIGGADFLHDAGCAPQQRRPRPIQALSFRTQLTLEARRHLERGQRATVVKFDAIAQGERPDQPVARHAQRVASAGSMSVVPSR